MRELALTFTAQRPPHPRSNTPQLHTPRLKLLAATDNPATIVTLSDQRESKGLSFRSFQVQPSRSRFLIANDNPTKIVTLSDQRESKGLSFLLLKPARERFLIANLELELPASHTKISLLTFSNRKKIAVFDLHFNKPTGRPHELSSPLAYPGDRCRHREAIRPPISNLNSRFTEFRSTWYKYTPYRISDRNKSTHFAFSRPQTRLTNYESPVRISVTTSRASCPAHRRPSPCPTRAIRWTETTSLEIAQSRASRT